MSEESYSSLPELAAASLSWKEDEHGPCDDLEWHNKIMGLERWVTPLNNVPKCSWSIYDSEMSDTESVLIDALNCLEDRSKSADQDSLSWGDESGYSSIQCFWIESMGLFCISLNIGSSEGGTAPMMMITGSPVHSYGEWSSDEEGMKRNADASAEMYARALEFFRVGGWRKLLHP